MNNPRITQLFQTLSAGEVAIFYSGNAPKKSNDQHYPFEVNRNFYYLTGIDQADVYLVLIKGSSTQKSILYIEQTDPLKALWDGAGLSFEDAQTISKVDQVKARTQFDDLFKMIFGSSRQNIYGDIQTVYLDIEVQALGAPQDHITRLSESLQTSYPFITIKNIHLTLARMRTVKDDHEIEAIKTALKVTKKAFHQLMKKAKNAHHEYELDAEYTYVLGKQQMKPSFGTIIASGQNATVLHYVDNNQPLEADGLILVDAGAAYQHYASDITRTFPKNGVFSPRQKALYELVLKVNMETIDWVRPGITLKEFNDFGKNLLIKGAKNIGLIKEDSEIDQYYYHTLGHNLGLDVHDVADYSEPFKVGQVLTVEPGLYIAEEGIGIRIEDDIVLTENGCINLSKDIIKTVEDIESYMK